MPFQKGQSGNPGGRAKVALPDGTTITDLARSHTAEAIKTLANIMKSKKAPEAARVSAAAAVLDRGWGRPRQAVDLTVEDVPGAAEALEAARRAAAERNRSPEQSTAKH
jgi:hypothetical protein